MSKEITKRAHYRVGVNGTPVEVSEEIYLCYYRAERRMRYYERDIKTETAIRDKDGNIIGYAPSKEDSLERLTGIGIDFADEQETVEDTVVSRLMSGKLHDALDKLPDGERKLIESLFLSNNGAGMSEREYAAVSGIPNQTIHSRKIKALNNLKKLIEKN